MACPTPLFRATTLPLVILGSFGISVLRFSSRIQPATTFEDSSSCSGVSKRPSELKTPLPASEGTVRHRGRRHLRARRRGGRGRAAQPRPDRCRRPTRHLLRDGREPRPGGHHGDRVHGARPPLDGGECRDLARDTRLRVPSQQRRCRCQRQHRRQDSRRDRTDARRPYRDNGLLCTTAHSARERMRRQRKTAPGSTSPSALRVRTCAREDNRRS